MDSPGIDLEEGATLIEELSDWPALDDIFYDDATKFEGSQGEQIDIDTVIAATSPFGLDFNASAVRPSPSPSEASLAQGAHYGQDLGKHEVAPEQNEGTVDATHKKRRASQIRSREMSCRVCYLEKALCDRNFPCGRCVAIYPQDGFGETAGNDVCSGVPLTADIRAVMFLFWPFIIIGGACVCVKPRA